MSLEETERNTGLYRLVSIRQINRFLRNALRMPGAQENMVRNHIKPSPMDSILDLGCGDASMLAYFPDVRYIGIDTNPQAIAEARNRFGSKGEFMVGDFSLAWNMADGQFDIIIAYGLIHHVTDTQALSIYQQAYRLLRPQGRLVTLDPAFVHNQHPIAYLIGRLDAGAMVRYTDDYVRLGKEVFSTIHVEVRDDIQRIPSNSIFLECIKEG
ncbi:MAG: class I SAM-dependent methyltransferase [Magnetococcales bacterium]|nr:class I SAM-dependent methyltransferase [Magnetococcales bacterium]